jgi:hypothetical protein
MSPSIRLVSLLAALTASLASAQPMAPAEAPASAATAAPKTKAAASAAPTASTASTSSKGASKNSAAVVITVGPNKIRKRQIDTLVQLMVKVKQAPENMDSRQKEYLERMVATNLIGQELLDLEAKRLNVIADEKSIDSLSKAFKANFPNNEACATRWSAKSRPTSCSTPR